MAEMIDRSDSTPETSSLTRAQLAIAEVIGKALAGARHTSVTNSQDHSTTSELYGPASQQSS